MNMPANQQQKAVTTLQQTLSAPNVAARIEQRLGEKAGAFITSILDLAGETKLLAECNPNDVIKEGLKAASLDLPINKNLGFAYVIPYNESSKVNGQWVKKMMPHFQMGYKGFLQLAIRTGQYKYLNAGVVYEGEEMIVDRIHGTLDIAGKATSDKPIGYFAYMQLINGFEKAIGWTADKVMRHAAKYSKSFNTKSSPWKTDTEAMALKTMILQLVPKYGPMTIEMTQALTNDRADVPSFDRAEVQIEEQANRGDVIDIKTEEPKPETPKEPGPMTDEEKAEIQEREAAGEDLGPQTSGPDF